MATRVKPISQFANLADSILEATIVASFTSFGFRVRSRLEHWREPSDANGRVIVVTGATSGLGLAMARRLALLGARVHLVGRSETRLEFARQMVSSGATEEVTTHRCDLSSLRQTGELAQRLSRERIDVLIHNAGALLKSFVLTDEGVETTLAVHLLSPYLLTEQLIAASALAPQARVISMTSGGMYSQRFDLTTLEMGPDGYRGATAYARAKRAQTILNAHWQQVYGPSSLAFHLVHPGWADTPGVSEGIPGFAKIMGPFLRSPDEGADTAVWLAASAPGEPTPGMLWHDRHPRELHRLPGTRLDTQDEQRAHDDVALWCQRRVARALNLD